MERKREIKERKIYQRKKNNRWQKNKMEEKKQERREEETRDEPQGYPQGYTIGGEEKGIKPNTKKPSLIHKFIVSQYKNVQPFILAQNTKKIAITKIESLKLTSLFDT